MAVRLMVRTDGVTTARNYLSMERTHCSKPVKGWYEAHKLETCAYIWYLLYTQTYVPLPNEKRTIHKRGKGDKDRNADISDVFDRIIHNIILIVYACKERRTETSTETS